MALRVSVIFGPTSAFRPGEISATDLAGGLPGVATRLAVPVATGSKVPVTNHLPGRCAWTNATRGRGSRFAVGHRVGDEMRHRATSGSLAGVALGLLIAAVPGFLLVTWLPLAFLASALLVAAIAVLLWANERRERRRRRQLAELIGRDAVVGEEVISMRHGPTFAAWCSHAQALLEAAIGRPAGEAFATTSPTAHELDPIAILAGTTFGSQYVANLRAVSVRLDTIASRPGFDPSAWSTFDPADWELAHVRKIAWEPQEGAPCPWCGERIYPSSAVCGGCGAQVGEESAFR
jgi:hypothetical protein